MMSKTSYWDCRSHRICIVEKYNQAIITGQKTRQMNALSMQSGEYWYNIHHKKWQYSLNTGLLTLLNAATKAMQEEMIKMYQISKNVNLFPHYTTNLYWVLLATLARTKIQSIFQKWRLSDFKTIAIAECFYFFAIHPEVLITGFRIFVELCYIQFFPGWCTIHKQISSTRLGLKN